MFLGNYNVHLKFLLGNDVIVKIFRKFLIIKYVYIL